MPKEMIHEQTGLRIWRNEKNKFVICELRFESDPSKRSAEWLAESKAGLSEARWNREYNIQWDALDGQKVFPEIVQSRSNIIVPYGSVTFKESQVYFGGFDFGIRNESAFIVFTVDESGTIYAVWELYEPCNNMGEFVRKMKECPYWGRIRHIVADLHLWDKRGFAGDGLPISPYEMFCQFGVRNFIKGASDAESAWLLLMRGYWGDPQDIQFKIFNNCQNLIEEFEGARYANMTEMMAQNKNVKEEMIDKNNHAMDATKYWMTTHRRNASAPKVSLHQKWKWRN